MSRPADIAPPIGPDPRPEPRASGAPRDAFARLSARAATDRSRREPLWMQVREVLAEMIADGTFRPDDQMPSEQALVAMFGVSRPVVREALAALVKDGLVVKISRRGVFVAEKRQELDFAGSNVGLFGDMTSKGHEVTTVKIELARIAPNPRERSLLALPTGEDIVKLRRVYLIDGRPIAIGAISVPASQAPGLEKIDFENQSFYATLRAHFGIVVARAERWLEAVIVDGPDAERLQLAPGTPVIRIESIGWTADGKPVEYYNSLYNTKVSRVHMRAVSTGGAPGPASPNGRGAEP